MYLKSLVLKGFKSFADRSALTLEPGITAIVGPNGSGKSNISDAVLWVLGERNAKHLRGSAMEDVIFAGSSARKATGLAEVDLVLDNSDGTLPVDYDEVAITRRMYRSGESEYLINGTVARRMDVLDILHDSGLGTGTHSIISQGSLDSILQSKPEDRRALIEEAAGVLKHKQRKAKSERKLANMDAHLDRARDVVAEVSRQLGPLERKAKKARTYAELADELASVNLKLAVDDLRRLQRAWDAAVAGEGALAADLDARRAAIDAAEAQVEALQERIRRESVDASELSRQHRAAAAAVERFDSTTMVIRERQRAAVTRAGEIELVLEAARAKRAAAEADLAGAQSTLEQVRSERAAADARVAQLDAAYRDLGVRRGSLERESSALGRDVQAASTQLDVARRKHAQTQEALTNGLAHVKVIESHAAELDLQLARVQADAKAASSEAQAATEALGTLDAQESAARKLVGTCYQAREAARAALDQARDAEQGVSAQIQALEEVERAAAAAAGPARAWLAEHEADVAGALEPLAHAVRAQDGLEALTEALLGDEVAALLVDDASCAVEVARLLSASEQDGEVTLVLREDARAAAGAVAGASGEPAAAGVDGASGARLIDALEYPSSAARAVRALLGDVVVCETLDAALRAHASDAAGLRFAVRDGSAVVWPSGKVTIGAAVEEGNAGVLARMRHLEELRAGLEDARAVTTRAQEEVAGADEALRDAQASSLELSQKLAELRGAAEAARVQADRATEKLAAVRREIEGVQRQREEAEAVISSARPDVETYEHQIAELTQKIEAAKRKQDDIQAELAPLRREAHRVSDELAQAKLDAAKLAERDTYTARVLDARTRELEQLRAQTAESSDLLAVKNVSAKRLTPLLAVFDELAASARRWTRDLEDRATAAQDSSTGLHAQVTEARNAARAAHDAYDQTNEKLSAARVEKGRLELQVESAVNVIAVDCKTPLETALVLPALEEGERAEAEETAFRLNRRIANLGTINPDAAAEYDELKSRYDYLAGQLADLDAARKSLAKINRVIDVRMKDDFVRTFDEVNDNFQEIFATLFPGGAANLALVDPDDLENTGVEVNAQPAGKRITKMMLMSGGEKSLTALALLFAVYRTRSTPFYILDEVEAALDDTNLRRLVAYIDQLRDTTQLIMITHQRRTMEMADVLFGVSMQSDGVTKVISQKLEKALRYAE
ncbi:MAG: chromosome segregation protein SMC [Eggerthellaceae bacterium]|nr:chromosome segregation protein SMC [Eggerthellaceae bacterium]